jgi:hypothetical protein
MFERPAHREVAKLLDGVDGAALAAFGCCFGGGTRIALELGEFRESRDLDFLTSDGDGFAALRLLVRDRGCGALFAAGAGLSFPREARIDQYAVRFPVAVGAASLRVELIREARIVLDAASVVSWCRAPCLTIADCFAEKLLANSDRWPDDSVLSRDLIDLAALRARFGAIPPGAWAKAEGAYRAAPRLDLRKAAVRFLAGDEHRERCFSGLGIEPGARLHLREAIARWATGLE